MAMNAPHPPLTPLTSPPSQSYIHPTPSIPTTPSLLSRQNSFFTTTTTTTTTTPHPPHRLTTTARSVPSTPATGGTKPRHHHNHRRRKHDGTAAAADDDDDWLIRTASHLTMSRLEEKGVSWLAARESSTSLQNDGDGDDEEEEEEGRGMPYYSANASRQRSYASIAGGAGRKSRRGSAEGRNEMGRGGVPRLQGPDFVDERDGREMRDVLGMGGLEDGEVEQGREEGGGEVGVFVDDREMRRVVMGRIGGWVDWAVGWMDFRDGVAGDQDVEEEGGEDGEDGDEFEKRVVGQLDVEEVKRRLGAKGRTDEEEGTSMRDRVMIPPPPAGDQAGILSDARWLLTIAGKLAV